jgi:hypothetical protein
MGWITINQWLRNVALYNTAESMLCQSKWPQLLLLLVPDLNTRGIEQAAVSSSLPPVFESLDS